MCSVSRTLSLLWALYYPYPAFHFLVSRSRSRPYLNDRSRSFSLKGFWQVLKNLKSEKSSVDIHVLFQKLILSCSRSQQMRWLKSNKTQVTFGRYHADVGQCQLQTRQLTKPIWQPSRFEGFLKKSLVLRFLIIRTYPKKITASPKAHVNVM